MFLEFNSKGLYQSLKKEKESCCLVFRSSTKRESRHFHVVVVQRRLRSTKKRDARAKLLFCQSKPIALLSFSLPSPSSSFQHPIISFSGGYALRFSLPMIMHEYQFGRPDLTCGQRKILFLFESFVYLN